MKPVRLGQRISSTTARQRRVAVALLGATVVVAVSVAVGPLSRCVAAPGPSEPSGPRTPEQERATFQFADGALVATLVASEPDVISPVAMAWDETGALWVAEMRDYPTATNGGVIRRLVDVDGDGRYAAGPGVFADGLPYPNSVLPWEGGVLVTAAPDLWFLRDADGDGRAEERRLLFTGFGAGNQQLRANGLVWGVDGWVYGANGRSDGAVRRPGSTNVVSLRGRDFRFRPDTGDFESLAGRSQFGLGLDDWGNRFLSWNTIPARHEVFPDRYLARHGSGLAADVVIDLMPAGDAGEVHPLTPSPLVFNAESSGHFNALAGLHVYRGRALGAGYRGNLFVGETLRNLVHRRVLEPTGSTFVARRPAAERGGEFLRSTDPWFHPVNFATGPDGALYVADFYRRFVEHPDFVPREMRGRMPWQEGSGHGRIWRIARKGAGGAAAAAGRMDWARMSGRDLARAMDSDNPWGRDTAARLLRARGKDDSWVGPVRDRAWRGVHPESRWQALSLLGWRGALEEADLLTALRDPHPGVRAGAALLAGDGFARAGSSWAGGRLVPALVTLTESPEARVRLQVLLALGQVDIASGTVRERVVEPVLRRLAREDADRWVRLAALSGLATVTAEQFREWVAGAGLGPPLRPPPVVKPGADPDRAAVVERMRPALTLAGDRARGAAIAERLCLACHHLQGKGQRVGPDLSGVASRPADALLVDILDPSRQVAPDYAAYEVRMTDGETALGLISSETATRVTVRRAGAPDANFARSQVASVRATGRSLMPDGLEAGWTVQDLADLLAYLRQP